MRKKKSKIKKILLWIFIPILTLILANVALYIIALFTPKVEIKTANSFSFYNKDNDLFFSGNSNSEWVKIEDISPEFCSLKN